ncbi:hypothetical protein DO71_6427 [Burkholderia pseudomallei]|nr:hypothetical protein DO71_6427 [Burkholderia pseudomallei]KGD56395.1 hypothetical protein DP49_2802 [Burkholderia pseudomallei]KGD56437.1 hypothetical protein DP49_2809 [Burkholderia pseudomallei]KGX75036.1 hypothetical protein Y033_4689 [Burkholderia pseudomallei MSHR435]
MSAVPEVFWVRNCSNDGGSRLGANPFNLRDALTGFTGLEHQIDTSVEACDTPVQLTQLIHQIGEHLARERRQGIRGVGDDDRNLPTRTGNRLREHDASLSENAPHLTHKSCPVADKATTGTMKALHILLLNRLDRHEAH